MFSLFSKHPASVGESYLQHFVSAVKFSLAMVVGCMVCLVHAVLPFLFQQTGSKIIEHLHDNMVVHRDRREAQGTSGPSNLETTQ